MGPYQPFENILMTRSYFEIEFFVRRYFQIISCTNMLQKHFKNQFLFIQCISSLSRRFILKYERIIEKKSMKASFMSRVTIEFILSYISTIDRKK